MGRRGRGGTDTGSDHFDRSRTAVGIEELDDREHGHLASGENKRLKNWTRPTALEERIGEQNTKTKRQLCEFQSIGEGGEVDLPVGPCAFKMAAYGGSCQGREGRAKRERPGTRRKDEGRPLLPDLYSRRPRCAASWNRSNSPLGPKYGLGGKGFRGRENGQRTGTQSEHAGKTWRGASLT